MSNVIEFNAKSNSDGPKVLNGMKPLEEVLQEAKEQGLDLVWSEEHSCFIDKDDGVPVVGVSEDGVSGFPIFLATPSMRECAGVSHTAPEYVVEEVFCHLSNNVGKGEWTIEHDGKVYSLVFTRKGKLSEEDLANTWGMLLKGCNHNTRNVIDGIHLNILKGSTKVFGIMVAVGGVEWLYELELKEDSDGDSTS